MYFRARWYNPETGRWISKDPKGIAGGLNLYVFCSNDSVNRVDPSGLQEFFFIFEEPPVMPIPPELLDEAIRLNEPRARVPLPDGRDVDLWGRPHGDIDTPHTHEPLPPFEPPYDELFPRGSNPTPRPSTIDDIKDVIDHLKNSLHDLIFGKPNPCQMA